MIDYLHKVPVMQSPNGISLSWTPSLFSIENFWLFVGQTQEPILLKIFQIQLKISFVAIPFLAITSLQNFPHAMTAQLSWHVQNFVVIT